MVQAATEETREIQNAHRLRLQDLQSRIDAMEQQRAKLMDFLAKMIAELQETQDYAQQNTPQPLENKETTEPSAEPQLDLSPTAVDAAASALRTEDTNDAQPAPAHAELTDEDGQPRNCVVAPGWNDHANDTRVARPVPDGPEKQPQPEYFDTTPTANELHTLQTPPTEAAAKPKEEVEIPGAIFSYPILRQKGEPILDEEPPVRGPHTPLLPNLDTDADEEDDDPLTAPAAPAQSAPQPAAPAAGTPAKVTASGPRRKKAVAALRALRRKLGEG